LHNLAVEFGIFSNATVDAAEANKKVTQYIAARARREVLQEAANNSTRSNNSTRGASFVALAAKLGNAASAAASPLSFVQTDNVNDDLTDKIEESETDVGERIMV
jgi:hypothetical protein